LSRSVIEKVVSSQDFWDLLFSYRNSLVPDEHVFINAVKRILPDEQFIYRTVHKKMDLLNENVIDDKEISTAIEQGYWFVRKIRQAIEWQSVARIREKYFSQRELKYDKEIAISSDVI